MAKSNFLETNHYFFVCYFLKLGILFLEVRMMKEEKKQKEPENVEYGEFISSYFAWKTLKEQKEIANKLANITKEEKE